MQTVKPLDDIASLTLKVQRLKQKVAAKDTGYRHDIRAFCAEQLDITLWDSEIGDSQLDLARAVQLSYQQQHERMYYELGTLLEEELQYWKVGEPIKTVINVVSGHGVGKTAVAASIALFVYAEYSNSIVYTFSPSKAQAQGLLWKEIATRYKKGNIDGRLLLDLKLKDDKNAAHYIEGRTVPRNKKGATESIHGQHAPVFLAILDEAQAYQQSLFDGIESILGSGITVMVMLSNPKDANAPSQKYRKFERTHNFTISCFNHPNVYYGKQIIQGGVTRDYVDRMLDDCEIVEEHEPARNTFTVPWIDNSPIYVPTRSFSWRVLGIASSFASGNTFLSVQMFEQSLVADVTLPDPNNVARIGIDVARFGADSGSIFYRHRGTVQHYATVTKQDGVVYVNIVSKLLLELAEKGITDVQVRIDATGGYGSTIEDTLNLNLKWNQVFDYFEIVPVSFRATATDVLHYYDIVTEMYDQTGKTFANGLVYKGYVPETLITELTERTYDYVPISGVALKFINRDVARHSRVDVKRISKKGAFRSVNGYSPDFADGLVLAVAPDWCFRDMKGQNRVVSAMQNLYRGRIQGNTNTNRRKRLLAW